MIIELVPYRSRKRKRQVKRCMCVNCQASQRSGSGASSGGGGANYSTAAKPKAVNPKIANISPMQPVIGSDPVSDYRNKLLLLGVGVALVSLIYQINKSQ